MWQLSLSLCVCVGVSSPSLPSTLWVNSDSQLALCFGHFDALTLGLWTQIHTNKKLSLESRAEAEEGVYVLTTA